MRKIYDELAHSLINILDYVELSEYILTFHTEPMYWETIYDGELIMNNGEPIEVS